MRARFSPLFHNDRVALNVLSTPDANFPILADLFSSDPLQLRKLDLLAAIALRATSHTFAMDFSWSFSLAQTDPIGPGAITASGSGTCSVTMSRSPALEREGELAIARAPFPFGFAVTASQSLSGSGSINGNPASIQQAGTPQLSVGYTTAFFNASTPQQAGHFITANLLGFRLVLIQDGGTDVVPLSNTLVFSLDPATGNQVADLDWDYPLAVPGSEESPFYCDTEEDEWTRETYRVNGSGPEYTGVHTLTLDAVRIEGGDYLPWGLDPSSPLALTAADSLWGSTGTPLTDIETIITAPLR